MTRPPFFYYGAGLEPVVKWLIERWHKRRKPVPEVTYGFAQKFDTEALGLTPPNARKILDDADQTVIAKEADRQFPSSP